MKKIVYYSASFLIGLFFSSTVLLHGQGTKGYEWMIGEWFGISEDYSEAARLVVTGTYYQLVGSRYGDETKEVYQQEKCPYSVKTRDNITMEFSGPSLDDTVWIDEKNHCFFLVMGEYEEPMVLKKVEDPVKPDLNGPFEGHDWIEGDWDGWDRNYSYHLTITPDYFLLKEEHLGDYPKKKVSFSYGLNQYDVKALELGDSGIYLNLVKHTLYMPVSLEDEIIFEKVEAPEEPIPFQLAEVKPSFNGGDANEFSKWVNSQLLYPETAKKKGIQGRVKTQFIIDSDGRVINVKVLKGVDPSLDAEAVRVISGSPKWKPGELDGRPVPVSYTFPVIFQLR